MRTSFTLRLACMWFHEMMGSKFWSIYGMMDWRTWSPFQVFKFLFFSTYVMHVCQTSSFKYPYSFLFEKLKNYSSLFFLNKRTLFIQCKLKEESLDFHWSGDSKQFSRRTILSDLEEGEAIIFPNSRGNQETILSMQFMGKRVHRLKRKDSF